LQFVGQSPVRGGSTAVEKPGLGEDEGAAADRRNALARGSRLPQGVEHRRIGVMPAGSRGNDHCVRHRDCFQAVPDHHLDATGGGDSPGHGSAHRHLVAGAAVDVGSAEQRRRHRQVERLDRRNGQDGNTMHG
jgi:hypothetical protein